MAKVVQVREVPDEVHAELTKQAETAGLSLNRFVLQEFERIARRGRNAEVLARALRRRGRRLAASQVADAVRQDRDLGR